MLRSALLVVVVVCCAASGQESSYSRYGAGVEGAQPPLLASLQGRKIGTGYYTAYKPHADLQDSNQEEKSELEKLLEDQVLDEVPLEQSEPLLKEESAVALGDDEGEDTMHTLVDISYSEDFATVFGHMFEIIIDILNIMRQTYGADTEVSFANEDTRPMLKGVLRRYIQLVRETQLLAELRQIIPLEELELALDADNSDAITRAIVKTFNPSLFVYVFNTLRSLASPLKEISSTLTTSLDVSELREYIPSAPSMLDITYPIRYIVHLGLEMVSWVVESEVVMMMRSYSPWSARALLDADPSTVVVTSAVGSLALAGAYSYFIENPEDNEIDTHSRYRREAEDEAHSLFLKANENVPMLIDSLEEKYSKNSHPKKYNPAEKHINYAKRS